MGSARRLLQEGEEPLDALCRELREETGVEVEPLELVGIWADRYGGDDEATATLNLYWTARIVSGSRRRDGRRASSRGSLSTTPPGTKSTFQEP